MFRIDHSTAISEHFTEGNPSSGIPATVVTAQFLNAVQDEIASTIEGAGLVLDKLDSGQLYQAILAIAGASSAYLPPVGAMIAHYDYNGSLTFNNTIWKYCDGSTATIAGIGSQTLPDASNRYLVGFGTEGGGDIDSAVWSTAIVGSASHLINLQHSHTVNAHTHDLNIASFTSGSGGSHLHTFSDSFTTNTVADHDHGALTGIISSNTSFTGATQALLDNTSTVEIDHHLAVDPGVSSYEGQHRHILNADGSHSHTGSVSGNTDTEAAHTHTVDPPNTTSTSASPGTDSQLSTIQSIQPRSIRVRWIMRVQ